MNEVAATIKELREERGWTQGELAQYVNALGLISPITQSIVSRIETNERSVPRNEQVAFARAFEMELDAFDSKWRASQSERSVGTHGIPVRNRGPAGIVLNYEKPSMTTDHGLEFLDRDSGVHQTTAFAIIVCDDSMQPRLHEDDYVLFVPRKVASLRTKSVDGHVVFVRFSKVVTGRPTCVMGRYRSLGDDDILLYKDNPGHPSVHAKIGDLEEIGVAVEMRSKRI